MTDWVSHGGGGFPKDMSPDTLVEVLAKSGSESFVARAGKVPWTLAARYRVLRSSTDPSKGPQLPAVDLVNHPPHYKAHPSGVECIVITEHMNFCRGNAVKYIWRAGEKGSELEDLKKARWYLDREIQRLEGAL